MNMASMAQCQVLATIQYIQCIIMYCNNTMHEDGPKILSNPQKNGKK
jgi:hypothetical protein